MVLWIAALCSLAYGYQTCWMCQDPVRLGSIPG